MNDVNELIKNIKEMALKNGLYLYRYQTNGGGFCVTVTYVLHNSDIRPVRSNLCSGYNSAVVMGQLEGTTIRCEAYRKLSEMLNYLE